MYCKNCGQLIDGSNHVCKNQPINSQHEKFHNIFLDVEEKYITHLSQGLLANLVFWGDFASQAIILSDRRLYFSGKHLFKGKLAKGQTVQQLDSISSYGLIKTKNIIFLILSWIFIIGGLIIFSIMKSNRWERDQAPTTLAVFVIIGLILLLLYFLLQKTYLYISNTSSSVSIDLNFSAIVAVDRLFKNLAKAIDNSKKK
jgi:hypothetical protein